jgi:FtsZ-binding cell division protein ZapB
VVVRTDLSSDFEVSNTYTIVTFKRSSDMQLENFERLEEKILQAVELIDKLKQENQDISSSHKKLEDQLSGFEKGTESLNLETEKLKSELTHRERDFIEKRAEIKRRLERILEKLAPLESEG